VQPLWKIVWRVPKKLKIELPYDSVVLLLGIYPKECKSGYNRDTYTLMFIAALFTMAKLWKQPIWHTTNEWIKKRWHIYIMELYLVIRNNDMWFEGRWMQLKDIMLSEVSQAQKDKGHMFSLIYGR
jgi:hypothetical protein